MSRLRKRESAKHLNLFQNSDKRKIEKRPTFGYQKEEDPWYLKKTNVDHPSAQKLSREDPLAQMSKRDTHKTDAHKRDLRTDSKSKDAKPTAESLVAERLAREKRERERQQQLFQQEKHQEDTSYYHSQFNHSLVRRR